MEAVQIYFKMFNQSIMLINFLAFLLLYFNFSLLDPDPGGKMKADPCGSGHSHAAHSDPRTALGSIWYLPY